ncbi:Holliday junction branch migration protein RuvA [Microbacterium sp. 13-71-7]|uniref:Holliday junction branch migration protein RuvA n=1 Tax=Microbacterium sp. 13-71-7 TaxID=1970399 RepID=UPI000BC52C8F|nr:Holliday junction branch migration protein RuvA [Microbacterium sp. 13-71-7]OZB83844.1 MAG: Holliday junction branch migration protein RuvA [Microbacterium sp. 13-71-7]
MISSLRGTVLSASTDSVIIEVGGVGFSVAVPGDVAHTARVGHELRLHTSLIVREDALSLYGFADAAELEVFGHLISVTGVGPKSALGVLSHLSVDQIATAVAADDDAPFRRVSGIGPKTAKLIVVQLTGKLHAPAAAPSAASIPDDISTQLIAALIGLGWSERVAAEAAERSATEASETERGSVALLLRRTLATLGPAQGGAARG